jgi:4-hydroxy-4-methyl-2-oxoglutarate aldolase
VRGAYRSEAAELQVPVSVGGAAILPGDIIVGDADGVVVVPQRWFAQIVEKARARDARETAIDERIAAGASYREATGG